MLRDLGLFAYGHEVGTSAVLRFEVEAESEQEAVRTITRALLGIDGLAVHDVSVGAPPPPVHTEDDEEARFAALSRNSTD
jgi:hypothetical protein